MRDPQVYQIHILSRVPTRRSLPNVLPLQVTGHHSSRLEWEFAPSFPVCSSSLLPTFHQRQYYPGLGFCYWRIPVLILCLHARLFSCIRLFATLWTVAHQAPCPWDSPGKNTGVGCHALLQGIFLTQASAFVSYMSCIGRQLLYH